jgi:hypothetical protein
MLSAMAYRTPDTMPSVGDTRIMAVSCTHPGDVNEVGDLIPETIEEEKHGPYDSLEAAAEAAMEGDVYGENGGRVVEEVYKKPLGWEAAAVYDTRSYERGPMRRA